MCENPANSKTESTTSRAHHRKMEHKTFEKSKNQSKNENLLHPTKEKAIMKFFEIMKPQPSPSPSYKSDKLSKSHPPTLSNETKSKVNSKPKSKLNTEMPPKFPTKGLKQRPKLALITRFFEKVKPDPGD